MKIKKIRHFIGMVICTPFLVLMYICFIIALLFNKYVTIGALFGMKNGVSYKGNKSKVSKETKKDLNEFFQYKQE